MSQRVSNTPSETVDESRPFPPRYHWLKRLSLFGLIMLIALGGLRAWWGHESQKRIDVLVAAAHARGEPILPEDFSPRDVPDSDNAAILYRKAAQSFKAAPGEMAFSATLPYSGSDLAFMDRMATVHAAELQLMRAGRGRHDAEWGVGTAQSMKAPRINAYFSADRRLALLMKYSAISAHALGEDRQAIEYFRDLLAYGNALISSEPSLIGLLVTHGVEFAGVETVIETAPTLTIAQAGDPSPGAARQQQIRSVIADLLDESRFQQNAARALFGEQTFAVATESYVVHTEIQPALLADFLWPMFQIQVQHTALDYEATVSAVRQENYPLALSKLSPTEQVGGSSMLEAMVRTDLMRSAFDRAVPIGYKLSAERRAAAMILAIRLYESEHAGRLPETLAELVPAYLPMVPLDPFSRDSKPLRYLPHRDPPLIYSVGLNGTDEGGSSRSLRPYSMYVWDTEDAVFPIRPASATTQPTRAGN